MRLVPSLDLVHRAIDVDTAFTIARTRVLERIPGNPIGIAYRTVDNVTALMAQHLPAASFNRVIGLRREQAHHVQPLVEWFREHGVAVQFELAAGDDDPSLALELARCGFIQSGCHAALIREPDAEHGNAE